MVFLAFRANCLLPLPANASRHISAPGLFEKRRRASGAEVSFDVMQQRFTRREGYLAAAAAAAA